MANTISFSKQIKYEICQETDVSKEKLSSLLSAFLRVHGTYKISNKKTTLKVLISDARIAKFIYESLKNLFDVQLSFEYKVNKQNNKTTYILNISKDVENLLDLLHIDIFDKRVNFQYLKKEEQVYGFLAGIFLACGSCNSPSTSNYHLEMRFKNPELATDVQKLLNNNKNANFNMRLFRRDENIILYLKKSDLISTFLVMIGAVDSCMEFENTRIDRDFFNIDNRMINIDSANYVKTLKSSQTQLEHIEFIDKVLGIKNIQKEKIRVLCELRLENKEASLLELADLMSEKLNISVSKSNISHLFRSIKELADKYGFGL